MTEPAARSTTHRRLSPVQWKLLALLMAGFAGTGAELLLLDHTEGFWQKVPLGLIVANLLALAQFARVDSPLAHRCLHVALLLAIAGGVAGLMLHFNGNLAFELELHPENRGWSLIWRTLKGATPALAPGMMILLGLLGLFALVQSTAAHSTNRNETATTKTA